MAKKRTTTAELAQPKETRIVFSETGSSGLQETMGFVTAAYENKLTWPSVQPIYARMNRADPECVIIGNTFTTLGKSVTVKCELPENPTDDDKRYRDFVEQDQNQNVAGGSTSLLTAMLRWTHAYGFSLWETPASVRSHDWTPPNGDEWRSKADDGLIGIRRFAWRDLSTFDRWQFDDYKRAVGMWQTDMTAAPGKAKTVLIPLSNALHLTYGDPNNPEGLTPYEAMYRLERIKYGLEVVNGIGFEHAAGYLNIKTTQPNTILSSDDKANIRSAARALMTAQQGNYATWPYGIEGEIKDVSFGAAGSLLEAIKYYGVLKLSLFCMQWIALSATTGAGSFAAMEDSSSMAVMAFNGMLDEYAHQYDDQIGGRLYAWNKASFPNMSGQPRLYFTHIGKEDILKISQFVSAMANIMPMGEEDWKLIRERVQFVSSSLPEKTEPTPEQTAQQTFEAIRAARQQVQR